MPALSRHEIAQRRARRRRRDRRRKTVGIGVGAVLLAAIVALAVAAVSGSDDASTVADPAPLMAQPVSPPTVAAGRPRDVTLARADGLEIKLPIARPLVTAVAFHALDAPSAVELTPSDGVDYEIAPRSGRSGPETAAVDVGAEAGTLVYAPVDGVVVGIVSAVVRGKQAGYEVGIAPSKAGGVLVRVTHLTDPPKSVPALRVGHRLTAGVPVLGAVADFEGIAEQELARYTNDSGNHVHIEVVRAETGIAP